MKSLGSKLLNFIDINFFGATLLFCSSFVFSLYLVLTNEYPPLPITVQKEFHPYVRDFIIDAKKHNVKFSLYKKNKPLEVIFGDPASIAHNTDTIGYCDSDNFRVIIDKKVWDLIPQLRQQLIDHELGHCLFDRIHRHIGGHNQPQSIMYPVILNKQYYEINKTALRKEMFDEQKFNLMPILKKHIEENEISILVAGAGDKEKIRQAISQIEILLNNDIPKAASIDFSDSPIVIEAKKSVDTKGK